MLKHFFLSSLLTILLGVNISNAQNIHKHNLWFSAGIGKSQVPSGMLALGYEFSSRPTQIVTRYILNTELFSDNQPNIKTSEIGLLYGLKVGKFRLSTGISGVWGINRGKFLYTDPDPLIYGSYYYEPVKYVTIGLPGEVRFITSIKKLRIGVTGFGNLNSKRSFAGANISLYIGQVR